MPSYHWRQGGPNPLGLSPPSSPDSIGDTSPRYKLPARYRRPSESSRNGESAYIPYSAARSRGSTESSGLRRHNAISNARSSDSAYAARHSERTHGSRSVVRPETSHRTLRHVPSYLPGDDRNYRTVRKRDSVLYEPGIGADLSSYDSYHPVSRHDTSSSRSRYTISSRDRETAYPSLPRSRADTHDIDYSYAARSRRAGLDRDRLIERRVERGYGELENQASEARYYASRRRDVGSRDW
jgi:hypothetical protein